MFRRIQDFLGSWGYETEATIKVFEQLSDESLRQKVHPEGRTLGRIAWHIVQTLPEMAGRTGLSVPGPAEDAPVPENADQITAAFRDTAASLSSEVQGWTDDDLEVEDDMYGEMWKRGRSLAALISHQTHHRGQMTVLMRQAGLVVPGVYGPAKEEWAQYGAPPQE